MVDFKETAKEIFDICTNISKSDGRATEKIEEILMDVYITDRPFMLIDNGAKKAILVLMLHQAGVPKSIMNTTRMQFEPLDIEKIADYLLDNGVELTNPFSKYITLNKIYSYKSGLCYTNGESSFDEDIEQLFNEADEGIVQ